MTSIRKFVYATLLVLSTLSLAPSLARAQETVQGQFTLSHSVHWQNATVPAGDYRFSFEHGSMAMLRLSKISGKPSGFMLPVVDLMEAKPAGVNQLILEDTPNGSYVSAMELPEFGMTMRFRAPVAVAGNQAARTATASGAAR